MLNDEAYYRLIDTIELLPEKYKIVLNLKFICGLSNNEIAEQLEIKPKTVSMQISRAKIKLQEMIKKV